MSFSSPCNKTEFADPMNTHFTAQDSAKHTASKYKTLSFLLLIVAGLITPIANAHLMVAKHGTLNFLDNSVYMVLSIPSSAFGDADEDNDEHLSLTEFSTHRQALIDSVSKHVSMSDSTNKLPMKGLMVSPVTPHDDPKAPAAQIIVMARFILDSADGKLSFQMNLFGNDSQGQSIEMTANRKSSNDKQVFEMTPTHNDAKLDFN